MKNFIKKFIKVFIFSAVIIGLLEGFFHFFTFNQYKSVLEKALQEQLNLKAEIQGDIKYKILPIPHLEAKKVSIKTGDNEKLINALQVRLYVGVILPYAASFKALNLKKVYINNAEFHFWNIKKYIEDKSLQSKLELDTLIISNSVISAFNEDGKHPKKSEIEKLNLKFSKKSWLSNNITLKADFEVHHQRFNLNADFKNIDTKGTSDAAIIKLYNDAILVSFEGKLHELFFNPSLAGKISAKIINVDNFSDYFTNSQYIKSILNNENIKIEGNLEARQRYANFNNITINSKNIHQSNVAARIEFDKDTEANVNAKVKSIDLDNMLAATHDDSVMFSQTEAILQKLLEWFDIEYSSKLNLLFNLEVDSIKLNKELISAVKFNFDSFAGNISLNTFEFNLPGESRFKLEGVVNRNEVRPIFIGEMGFISKKFPQLLSWLQVDKSNQKLYAFKNLMMKSEMHLIPNSLRLTKTKAALDNLLFIGSTNIRRDNDDKLSFYTKLRFNKVDGNDFSLDKMWDEVITKLYISDLDKTGELYSKFMDDYRWLRKFRSNISFDIIVDEFNLKNYQYSDLNLSFNIAPNNFTVDKIYATSDLARFNGRLSLALPSFRPVIDIDLNFDFLDSKFIENIFPSSGELRKALQTFLKSDQSANIVSEVSQSVLPEFNFFGAHNYNGSVSFKADQLVHNQYQISNIDISSTLSNGLIILNKMDANALEGKITTKGNIAILSAVPNFTLSFALYNVDPGQLTTILAGQNKMSGYLSASGSISSSGINMPSLIAKMQGSAEVLAKKITFKGFDIGEIVNTIDLLTPLSDKLKRVDYYVKYGESLFDNLKGKINVTNGIADFNNFMLENNRVGGAFAAKYDIYNKVINSVTKFSFIPINRTVPIEIKFMTKGPISNPVFTADIEKLTEYLKSRSQVIGENNSQIEQPTIPSDKESVLRKRLR